MILRNTPPPQKKKSLCVCEREGGGGQERMTYERTNEQTNEQTKEEELYVDRRRRPVFVILRGLKLMKEEN